MNMKDFLKAKTEKALKRRMKERAKAHQEILLLTKAETV